MMATRTLFAVALAAVAVSAALALELDTSFIREAAPAFASESEHAAFLEELRTQHAARMASKQHQQHRLANKQRGGDVENDASPQLSFSHAMHGRAMLMFRALDANHDKLVTRDDVYRSAQQLEHHMPGVTPDVFAVFIEASDKDGDGALNAQELVDGLAAGLEQHSSAELLQMGESLGREGRRRVGFFSAAIKGGVNFVKGAVDKVGGAVKNFLGIGDDKKAGGGTSPTDEGCVMCQYIVERCESNVRQSGVIPSMSASPSPEGIYLELESKVGAEAEAAAAAEAKDPFDMAGSTIIGTTRQSTRYQRLLERQKYNEIYRVVDITLDDVCEQGMPNEYYALCKSVYQVQADVVDGLRYQYRPADICFRVGMCQQGSYITQGIHSRYRPGADQKK